MKWVLWLSLTSWVWAVPGGCRGHASGYRGGGYYGYGRRASGPELPKVGGTLPGYNNEEAQRFPVLNRRQPNGSLAPFAPTPFDPSRMSKAGGTFHIDHPVEKAPPGY